MQFDRDRALGLGGKPLEDCAFYEVYADDQGASLEALLQSCTSTLAKHLRGYIWQKDDFGLMPSTSEQQPWYPEDSISCGGEIESRPPCLWGRTCYAENVEDAWFIVWLLLELTRQLAISARIWDSDGEFLLIEAAYALPEWLKPETAAERVWLRRGALHIIPQPSPALPSIPNPLTVLDAVKMLQSPMDTLASSKVQAAIQARLSEYPQQGVKNMHHAAVILPRQLAAVLQQEPQLVSVAVESFYYRDPDDVKAAHKLAHFDPEQEMVSSIVKFSRCLYAQMVTQTLQPPPNYMLPLPSEKEFSAAQLGMKLVAAFEMILARRTWHEAAGSSTKSLLKECEKVPCWHSYIEGLANQGFFQDELVGSVKHEKMMEEAALRFRQTESFSKYCQSEDEPASRIRKLMQLEFDPTKVTAKADSDAWMADGADEIEQRMKKAKQDDGAGEGTEPDLDLAQHFKDFLDREGGVDGIDELGKSGGADSETEDNSGMPKFEDLEGDIDLDEQGIWTEMQRILKLREGPPEKSDISDEGSSFYGDDHDLGSEDPNGDEELDALTATDSDDQDAEPGFFDQAYDDAMKMELRSEDAWKGRDLSNLYPSQTGQHTGGLDEEELMPVDVDLNLVQNLLASYEAQEGLAGPVGNLAGLLGLQLPSQKL